METCTNISTVHEESDVISNAGDNVRDILSASQRKPEDVISKATDVSNTSENLNTVSDIIQDKNESDTISYIMSDNSDNVTILSDKKDNTEIVTTEKSNCDKTSAENETPKIASDKASDADKDMAINLVIDTTALKNEELNNTPNSNEIRATEKNTPDNLTIDNTSHKATEAVSPDKRDDRIPDNAVDDDVEKEVPVVKSLSPRFESWERKRKPTDRFVPDEFVLRKRKPPSRAPKPPEPPKAPEKKPKRPEENRCKRKNCNMVFDTKKRLFYHERNAHTKEMSVFKCMQCNIHCESNKELRDHKDCHNDDTFMCQKCELAYDNHCNFLTHSITVHYPENQTYTCEECQRVLFDKQALKHHIQSHYNLNEQCPICNEYVHKFNLSQHRAAHNEIKCVECGKVCKGQAHYAAHLNVHIGFKPYQCIYCGKGFQNASGRKVHTDIHLGIRRHKCKTCNRTFRQLTDLQRHCETHEGKQFECSYCHKRFSHKDSLKQHLRGHTGDHLLQCPQCPRRFTDKTSLRSHIVHWHTRVLTFQCDICESKFLTKRGLMKHYTTPKHKQRAYAAENQNK